MTGQLIAEVYSRFGYILAPEEAVTWLAEKQKADRARIAELEQLLAEIVVADDAAIAALRAGGLRLDAVMIDLTERARAMLAEKPGIIP